jgi:predicted DNA-binding WGR domain protein
VTPAPLAAHLQFRSIDPEQNRFRFYDLSIQRTLWGEFAVVRQFGRIGTTGRRSVRFFASANEAQDEFDQEVAQRAKRLYVLVRPTNLLAVTTRDLCYSAYHPL